MSFLNYLDEFEFKTKELPKSVQTNKPLAESTITKVQSKVKPTVKFVPKSKNVIKKSKEPINETLSKANSILDGIDESGYNGLPMSTRYYDDSKPELPNNINKNVNVIDKANDLLSDDNGNSSMPTPLMNLPQMDEEMLKFVPQEMLTEEQRSKVNIAKIRQENSNKEVPSELQALMEQTKQMQNMFNNVDMSGIPQEFLH